MGGAGFQRRRQDDPAPGGGDDPESTSGAVEVLGERLGPQSDVDVYELRPRIGLASTSVGERMPAASWYATPW